MVVERRRRRVDVRRGEIGDVGAHHDGFRAPPAALAAPLERASQGVAHALAEVGARALRREAQRRVAHRLDPQLDALRLGRFREAQRSGRRARAGRRGREGALGHAPVEVRRRVGTHVFRQAGFRLARNGQAREQHHRGVA